MVDPGFPSSALEAIVQGPWGGPGGQPFYDGRGDIVEIDVTFDDHHVTKLQVSYAESTGVRWQGATHGSDRGKHEKITLRYPDEYLKQVVGTSERYVNSICFVTNKTSYGPFGGSGGEAFESPADGVVVGFFGRSGSIIDQLGVITTEGSADDVQLGKPTRGAVVAQGQWGGPGGWSFCDGGGDVVEVTVKHNDGHVTMLRAAYEHSGVRFEGRAYGYGRDGEESKVTLNFPTERLMQVKGTYDPSHFVTSITLITNKETYGPFGYPRGQHFQSLKNGVVGFIGRSGGVLDSLGVLTHVVNPWGPSLDSKPQHMEMDAVVNGPWGGPGGTDFYDGRGDVVELAVHYNKHAVTMLQVTYEQSGARFQSAPHGGASGDSSWSSRLGKGEESTKVSLNFPEEFLVQVTGTYGPIPDKKTEGVTSLSFVTSKQAYGPFGVPSGHEFHTPTTGVVGFFGKAGARLDQLGVFTKCSAPSSKLRYLPMM